MKIPLALITIAFTFGNVTPLGRAAEKKASTQPATALARPPLIRAILDRAEASRILELIDEGADVNARDEAGRSTALYYAASCSDGGKPGRLSVVKVLVENGADINASCIGGCTALHAACEYGSPEIVEYLISKGADVNAKDARDETPLHVAASRPLTREAKFGEAIVRHLMLGGPDVTGENIRHARAATERGKIINALLAAGADVNAVSGKQTPLDFASKEADTDAVVVPLLVEDGGIRHSTQGLNEPSTQPGKN